MRSRQSMIKRKRERERQEKRKVKAEKRAQRKREQHKGVPAPTVDPDIAGIVPGPQPVPWEEEDRPSEE